MTRPLTLVAPLLLIPFGTLQAADAPPPPNVLLVVADDWSHGHAGVYGCRWIKTPAFDRVAGEGLLFHNAYTPVAKCAPSRAAILTGRNPWQLRAAANHYCFFPPEFKTLFEALDGNGWFTGCTGKGWSPGIANDAEGKPRAMTGWPFNKRTLRPPTTGIDANDYAANFADFLDAAPVDKPWCFWYGSREPHREYEYGSGVSKGGKRLTDPDRVPGYWPDSPVVRHDMLDYAMEVEHFDTHLGRMLAELEKRGKLRNTLVIVTSDNGMPFPRVKGMTYHDSNHMPLAVMWPDGVRNPGRVVQDYISFVDLAPTIIELAGLQWEQTGMAPATGRSFTDLLTVLKPKPDAPARDHVLLGKERNDVGRPHDWGYPARGIVAGDMLYLRNYEPDRWPAGNPETGYLDTDGGATKTEILTNRRKTGTDPHWTLCFGKHPAEELYDLHRDPDCLTNLAGDPLRTGEKRLLETRMVAALKAQEDPRALGQGSVYDTYPPARESLRNFHERFTRGEKPKADWVNPSDFDIP